MKWYKLYKKIGNQPLNKMAKADVYAIIDDKEVLLELKYRVDGTLYLVKK